MKKKLSKAEVLKKLDIEDFQHLTKDKIVEFYSMLPSVDPEVIKQFPEFAKVMKSIVTDYSQEINASLSTNNESVKACHEASKVIIESLEKMLEKEDLTFDERMAIVGKMQEVRKTMHEKDSENKTFIREIASIAGVIVVFAAGATAAVLGVKSKTTHL